MSFYKTGDIAKRAGVTVRTMQYYDSIGLLHPSLVDEKGYRFYSDEDMVRLQKILCLKELGFGLEDIRTMTATDSYTSIKEALHYQIKALDRKISNLTKLRDNLVSVSDAPNWSRMFHSMRMGELESDIIEQYKNSTNLDIRIKLHKLYSVSDVSWFRWLYDHYKLSDDSRVLELGCGDGSLWLENRDRIKVTLPCPMFHRAWWMMPGKHLEAGLNMQSSTHIQFLMKVRHSIWLSQTTCFSMYGTLIRYFVK